jgi:thiol-disulfide isomerase/thioredoxin
MRIFLPLFFLLILLIPQGYSQSGMAYAPDFSMSAEAFENQVLQPKTEIWVLDFWASWCGPCIEAMPHVKEVQQRYASKGVRFISLSWDDAEARWLSALARLRMPWQQILVSNTLKVFVDQHFPHKAIPAAYVVRADGKIKRVAGIGMLESTIQKAIKAGKK